jgi:hypothetical protein
MLMKSIVYPAHPFHLSHLTFLSNRTARRSGWQAPDAVSKRSFALRQKQPDDDFFVDAENAFKRPVSRFR